MAMMEEAAMGEYEFLNREWVEIVLVLEDCTLIDSRYDMHVFDGPGGRAPGFYLAVHAGGERDFACADLVGPFAQRGMVEMLYDSALHLGAARQAGVPLSVADMAPASVLPFIRQQAATGLARPV